MMKKFFFIVIVGLLFLSSCTKDINDRSLSFPALQPIRLDTNAGSWLPILLTAPNEFACPAPIANTNPDYIAQVNEIKSSQKNMAEDDRQHLAYWGAGAVLRWNEIMRELVATHNLAPLNNGDGTYPFPNANNPLAYPLFPFANPPYAARAYAYLSAAMYDALIAATYYKQLYKRDAPYVKDTSLQVFIPKSVLPSYPSEDAVVIGVAIEMLKLLFPGDQDFIQQKAYEHKRCRLLSGANVRSDMEAGEALGKAVAQKFVVRARADRAGAAVGTQAVWTQMETDCIKRTEIPWVSSESPKRPPMLPLFGKVKAFLFDSATLVNQIRPIPPPSTSSKQFADELSEIENMSKNLTREQIRIAHFWSDGIGTYTPPGHWNAIACEDFVRLNYSEMRWARNLALLNISLMDAGIACWDAKYVYFNPRPSAIKNNIKTITGLPNFPAYISGHSTFSAAAATILGHLIPSKNIVYQAMAKEASDSRIYGAIHYRSDCEQGMVTGTKVGTLAVQRALIDGGE